MEALTKEIANEYMEKAKRLPPNGLQDIEERRKLRIELQKRCMLTEVEAVNTLNGHWADIYIFTSRKRMKEMEERNAD